MKLHEVTSEIIQLQEMLLDPDIDPEIVEDTLEAVLGDFESKLDSCGTVLNEMKEDIDAIDSEIKRLQKRKKVYENGMERFKDYIKTCMIGVGKKKIKSQLFSFTVRDGVESVIVDFPAKVPDEFLIPQPDKINNAAIKKKLKEGEAFTFAHLEKGNPSLLVK